MFLVDTNIFLEILLQQSKSGECKEFLDKNIGDLSISDFSLHSIGVILFRQKKEETFLKFISDMLPKVNLVTLPKSKYAAVVTNKTKWQLDFDDAYQYSICKYRGCNLATMDRDFKKINDLVVHFL